VVLPGACWLALLPALLLLLVMVLRLLLANVPAG
jgi:hypothetical protein